jgi:site-specific recombinase XerD
MTLLEAISATIRRLHYSPRTEEAYLHWIRAYVAFHGGRHPRTLGAAEVTAFLNHLAVDRHTSASTQNQALCAVVFLYRRVLALDLPELVGLERAQRPHHLPAVLSRREVNALLEHLEPPFRLVAELLYGSGLRLLESLSIRVKDVDLDRHQIMVRRGKGEQDRAALLPTRVRPALEAQPGSTRVRVAPSGSTRVRVAPSAPASLAETPALRRRWGGMWTGAGLLRQWTTKLTASDQFCTPLWVCAWNRK